MTVGAALEVVGVSKRYGASRALDDVHLLAAPGELHGLLGPNGAGKTTLIRICLGLVRPDGGSVRLLGGPPSSPGQSLRDGVAGFVETPGFYPYLSARKNLALLARLDRHRGPVRERIAEVLEQVGLSANADRRVAGFSSGMRQRLGIAAALLRSPRLLFLDEPTSSLDPGGAYAIRALTHELAAQGAAVVLSSHDLTEVEELCSAITVVNHGRVVFSGTVDELRRRAPATVYAMRTSNDQAACEVAARHSRMTIARTTDGSLEVSGDADALDAYVVGLGCAGIALRLLEHRTRLLESLFFELTRSPGQTEEGRAESGALVEAIL